jgi:hypothetical protein
VHRWSAWYPVANELLERRCVDCGSIERATVELLGTIALTDVLRALRRATGARLNGDAGEPHE